MTFAGWPTIRRLHHKVQRNILRNHQARYESSKTNANQSVASTNASTTTSSSSSALPRWTDPVLRPFRAYDRMQQRSPLMTQWESAIIIYYLGDLSSQAMVTEGFQHDRYEPLRGLRTMLIGAIAAIPGYKWFNFLGTNFNYRSHAISLCVKIGIHQVFFVPLFNSYFFGMQTLLAGGSFADAKERVMNTVPVSWVKSCQFWPIVNAFSFTFVPLRYRNVFTGVIAIGWQTYLSWLNREDENRQQEVHSKAKKEEQSAALEKKSQSKAQAQKKQTS